MTEEFIVFRFDKAGSGGRITFGSILASLPAVWSMSES